MMMEDIYENYNSERYTHYRMVPTGEYAIVETKVDGKITPIRRTILEKRKISFEEIKELNLDDIGTDVRTCADDFQLIHNYFFDFWGAILGVNAVAVYLHLKRYCFGQRDYCFPDTGIIAQKMGLSRNTVTKAMDKLEEYGFISKILRQDKERNNCDSTPFFKVRRYIPLLSENLLELLPDRLREEHDKFIAKTKGITLSENMDVDMVINNLMENAEVMKSKSQEQKENELKRQGKLKEYIYATLTSQEQEDWFIILSSIKEEISKPSFETWFKDSVMILDKEHNLLIITCSSDYARDWIYNQYKELIINTVKKVFGIKLPSFDCYTYGEYINRFEK